MWAAVLRRWRRHSGRFSPRLGSCTGGHEVKITCFGPLFGLLWAVSAAKSVSRTIRKRGSATARWPFHVRQPGKTRQAGPRRTRGACGIAARRPRRSKSAPKKKKCKKKSASPLSDFSVPMAPIVWERRVPERGAPEQRTPFAWTMGRAESGQRAAVHSILTQCACHRRGSTSSGSHANYDCTEQS